MRTLYILFFSSIIIAILLVVGTFVYLDREQHQGFFYSMRWNDRIFGVTRVDRYDTEKMLIYKSTGTFPYSPFSTARTARLNLNNDYSFVSYLEESSGPGGEGVYSVRRSNDTVSYVSSFWSRFAYLPSLPVRKSAFFFKEDVIATYLPLIANYDFSIGRAQGFYVLYSFDSHLPPKRVFLTVTSVRDEYLKAGGRKIKCECLFLRARGHPQITIWVAKHDRSLIRAEIHHKAISFERTYSVRKSKAYSPSRRRSNTAERAVSFKSGKTTLDGTLALPPLSIPRPAVLLLPDDRPSDRDVGGFFADLADRLAKAGIVSLRFDRRGMGSSSGDARLAGDEDDLRDAKAALDFLSGQKEVDARSLFVLGYSKGAYYAAYLASQDSRIAGIAMLAPVASVGDGPTDFRALKKRAERERWTDEYLRLAIASRGNAITIAMKDDQESVTLNELRLSLKRIRDEILTRPLDALKNVTCSVLMIHGAQDEIVPSEDTVLCDRTLTEAGNTLRTVTVYGYLDHSLGTITFDGSSPVRYSPDEQLTSAVIEWLKSIEILRKKEASVQKERQDSESVPEETIPFP